MRTARRQREIDGGLGTGAPLVPLAAVMVILDRGEDEVLHLVEAGELEFAFDISTGGAARREVRIYRESLVRYQAQRFPALLTSAFVEAGRNAPRIGRVDGKPEGDSTAWASRRAIRGQEASGLLYCITAILPQHGNLMLTAVELARCWTCSSDHVQNLLADGALAEASPEGRKRTHALCVSYASAEVFLSHRRIT